MLYKNLGINKSGHLTFAGVDTAELAKKYGTPLMLLDEQGIRENIRTYIKAVERNFGKGSGILYAGKALCITALYKILQQENVGADIMSGGEIYTALGAGFDMSRAYVHGNVKTDFDLEFAMTHGIGCIVVDSMEDAANTNRIAVKMGITQKVLVRLIPGIDTHTHKKILTGHQDSKFGVSIKTGEAERVVTAILGNYRNLKLQGFHMHVGSQIFEIEPFCHGAQNLIEFISGIKAKTNYEPAELNLGGGFAVRYVESQAQIDYAEHIDILGKTVRTAFEKHKMKIPKVLLEPGRSIVAANGITLYTAGAVKQNPGKNYVIVDGGMTDNPRFALYGAPYTVYIANKMNAAKDFVATIGGRCCESGDILQENVKLPVTEAGDIVALAVTGAYTYSMASNYNRIPRPPIVMINKKGLDSLVVRRETFEDLVRLDIC